jgi:hypothetical protein
MTDCGGAAGCGGGTGAATATGFGAGADGAGMGVRRLSGGIRFGASAIGPGGDGGETGSAAIAAAGSGGAPLFAAVSVAVWSIAAQALNATTKPLARTAPHKPRAYAIVASPGA